MKEKLEQIMRSGAIFTKLRQILKFFVTLGLNILRFYRPKVFLLKQILVKVDVKYYKTNKIPIVYVYLALF